MRSLDRLARIEGPTRVQKLRRKLRQAGHDVLLVSAQANIRYLTGFTGSSGYLLVTPEQLILHTDGRYETQARQQTENVHLVVSLRHPLLALAEDIKKRRIRRLAFEKSRLSYETYERLRSELTRRKLEPLDGMVEELRRIKSPGEIERIRQSVILNSEAFERVCRRVRRSWTEQRLAAEIEFEMRRLGAERAAFDTIVAGGAHSALPHAEPRRTKLEQNTVLLIDQGAILDGYTSDMTRIICLGRLPTPQRRLLKAVREAQQAAVDRVRAGVKARSVDHRAREVLRKHKLADAFTHSTGHGLGLEIHEYPKIGRDEEVRLATGMVITIEPGAYVENLGGVRIEDVVAVTPNGCDILTPTPRGLRTL